MLNKCKLTKIVKYFQMQLNLLEHFLKFAGFQLCSQTSPFLLLLLFLKLFCCKVQAQDSMFLKADVFWRRSHSAYVELNDALDKVLVGRQQSYWAQLRRSGVEELKLSWTVEVKKRSGIEVLGSIPLPLVHPSHSLQCFGYALWLQNSRSLSPSLIYCWHFMRIIGCMRWK